MERNDAITRATLLQVMIEQYMRRDTAIAVRAGYEQDVMDILSELRTYAGDTTEGREASRRFASLDATYSRLVRLCEEASKEGMEQLQAEYI